MLNILDHEIMRDKVTKFHVDSKHQSDFTKHNLAQSTVLSDSSIKVTRLKDG